MTTIECPHCHKIIISTITPIKQPTPDPSADCLSDMVFEYLVNAPHGEFKRGENCVVLGFTYQDVGPVVWTANIETGVVAGCNPSDIMLCVEMKKESE